MMIIMIINLIVLIHRKTPMIIMIIMIINLIVLVHQNISILNLKNVINDLCIWLFNMVTMKLPNFSYIEEPMLILSLIRVSLSYILQQNMDRPKWYLFCFIWVLIQIHLILKVDLYYILLF